MILFEHHGQLVLQCLVSENSLPKRAGFVYAQKHKVWTTPFSSVAYKLSQYLSTEEIKIIDQLARYEVYKSEASKKTYLDYSYPLASGSLFPFQKAGVSYILQTPRCLVADEMGCIDGEAVIQVNRGGCLRKIKLRDAYLRLNGIATNSKYNWDRSTPTNVRALCGDRFGQHGVENIISKGIKPVLKLTLEDGKTLRLTCDHEVMTLNGWVRADQLDTDDLIMINGTDITRRIHGDGYWYLRGGSLWRHPRNTTSGLLEHVWLAEAMMGRPLEKGEEVHHKNKIRSDNSLANLEVLSKSDHAKRHQTEKHFRDFTHKSGSKVITIPKYEWVKSVDWCGTTDVYDIVMKDPHRNFVANGIVVHNCGKTVQAIAACNAVCAKSVLIICPASLKINWAREWEKFSTLNICPTIINYDILKKNSVAIHSQTYDVLILDECHYIKNEKAQRTKEIVGEKVPYRKGQWVIPPISANRVIALTGTPILNRPEELYVMLKYLLPSGFTNKFDYGKRYCDGHHNGFGWDFSGSSNLNELQKKLRSTIMLRRLKKDVLLDLPNKVRTVIEFDIFKGKKVLKKEKKLFDFLNRVDHSKLSEEEFRRIVETMETPKAPGFEDLSKIRKEVAEVKLPMCIEHLRELLESSDKVVCFCHHIDTARGIQEAFGKSAVMLIGGMSEKQKQKAVDRFQNDSRIKLFIGNIKAAGVGLTLTASSTVVFIESDWVPGNMSQAEDRCHRIGQKDSVLVQHLVLAGSLDAYMARMIVMKQEIIESAVDESSLTDDIRELLK